MTGQGSGSRVQMFYAGRSVLVTGGTGFLGKLLIEKLIRACPDVRRIYVLARPREGEDACQKIEKLLEEPVFDRLRREVPDYREKIRPVSGDYLLPGLGLSDLDLEELLNEISIVFNVAATVRFDETLRRAILINVAGTDQLMRLCLRMRRLKVIMHVSTMFSNCVLGTVDETFYDPPTSVDDAISMARTLLDEDSGTVLESKSIGRFPNVYVYTKCIAEDLVRRYGSELLIGVFRPAIIVSSYREPVEGWVDNMYGPTGLITGAGIGLLKTAHINKYYNAEIVPADYTANALLVAAWAVANQKEKRAEPIIYNYHSSWNNGITWGQYIDLAIKHGRTVPNIRSLWCYDFIATDNFYLYFFLDYLLHYVPAVVFDVVLYLSGRKPRIRKLYGKLQKILKFTQYFRIRNWMFAAENTKRLWEELAPEDREIFPFSMTDFDWDGYMWKYINGIRLYIFKDDPSTIPRARKRLARFEAIQATLKYILLGLGAWVLLYGVYVLLNKNILHNSS